jgi:hypothetical protein
MTGAKLGEVRNERRNNLIRYVSIDARQRIGDGGASDLFWDTLAEAYVEGGCKVHIHFRAGLVNDGIAGNWCAVFNRKCDWLDFVGSDAFRNPERETGNACGQGDIRQAVLVDVGKLVELTEGSLVNRCPRLYGCNLLIAVCASGSMHPILLRHSCVFISLSLKMGNSNSRARRSGRGSIPMYAIASS